jgi:hypothetical protein
MKKKLSVLVALAAAAASVLSLSFGSSSASADLVGTASQMLGRIATISAATLVPTDTTVAADQQSKTAPFPQPCKLKHDGNYQLFGTAKDDLDPENASNEVISFDTTDPNAVAGAYRKLGEGVRIDCLDNQVELKYYYSGRTCGGGSTRVQLGIDRDGDKKFDGNAFGYLGDKPFGGTCTTGAWTYEDMTDAAMKWDISQLGGGMTNSWDQMETYLNTTYPNHRVLDYVLVDDSQGFFVADAGCAYFDLVTSGPKALTDHSDTSDGGKKPNSC